MFDIQVGQQHFSLLSAYKPLSVKNEIFTKEMSVLLDLAILNRPDVIYIGDLNCDLLHPVDNGKQGRNLLDICDLYDLHNLINEPTKVSSTKESCLDAILTNVPSLVLKSATVYIGLSDHMLIYTILNKKLMKPKARFIKERFFKGFNEIEFNKDLQIFPFHVAYVFNEIDDIYWAWERLYNNVLDDHAPIKCKKSQGKLWWTKIHYNRDKKCHKCKCSVL